MGRSLNWIFPWFQYVWSNIFARIPTGISCGIQDIEQRLRWWPLHMEWHIHLRTDSAVWLSHESSIWPWSGVLKSTVVWYMCKRFTSGPRLVCLGGEQCPGKLGNGHWRRGGRGWRQQGRGGRGHPSCHPWWQGQGLWQHYCKCPGRTETAINQAPAPALACELSHCPCCHCCQQGCQH